MDIDRGLVKAILREGIAEFHAQDVAAEMLEASGREAFNFVDAYWRKHGRPPTLQILEDQTGVSLHDLPHEPVSFWVLEIKKRHLYTNLQQVMAGVMDKLEAADPNSAMEKYRDGFFALEGLFKSASGVELIFDDIDGIMEEYERSKLGITGIPTPYPSLNEVTQGWQPEDFIVIAGRPGQGKSSMAIICSLHAWQNGRKTMMVSTEMSRMAMRRRHASFVTKTSYSKLKRGKLTTAEEESFRAALMKLKGDKRLIMMGKNMRVNLESVEAQAMIHKPDLLIIDGFYLLRSALATSKMKSDRIAELLDATKEMGKRLSIPIIITTQMNRGSEKGKAKGPPDLERLAFSDNMGMIADYVFFLDRNQKMRDAREMRITPVKIREGEFIGSIISTWDFEKVEFHQRRIDDGISQGGGVPPPEDSDAPVGSATLPDGRFPDDDKGPW